MNFHTPHSHITATLHIAAALLLFAGGNHSIFAVDDIPPMLSAKDDATTRPTKPNILIMMADDMGIGDTSAYLNVRLSPASPPVSQKHYAHRTSSDSHIQQLYSLMAMHQPLCAVQRVTLYSPVVSPTGRILNIKDGFLTAPTRR